MIRRRAIRRSLSDTDSSSNTSARSLLSGASVALMYLRHADVRRGLRRSQGSGLSACGTGVEALCHEQQPVAQALELIGGHVLQRDDAFSGA
jgi:uncharacterized membrane protein